MSKQWYVVQTASQFEKAAAESLRERISRMEMGSKFGQVIVPTEEVVEMRGGQKRRSERKFYPGYMLVEMDLDDDTWLLVKNTSRISGFVGGGGKPIPLQPAEVEKIMERMKVGSEQATPKEMYEPGEEVRVIDGPFNDFNGTVEEVNYEKSRLQVAVMIFGRSTPVELAFEQVEKG